MASDYDKLKEMYRLQGQEEQDRRFNEMTAPRQALRDMDSDTYSEHMRQHQEKRERSFRNPNEPLAGLEPIPGMQRSIDAERQRVSGQLKSVYSREESAEDAAKSGQREFGDRYGINPEFLLDLESRGVVTLSPEAKAAAARVLSLQKKHESAQREGFQTEWDLASPVLKPKPGGGYEEETEYRIGLLGERPPGSFDGDKVTVESPYRFDPYLGRVARPSSHGRLYKK